MPYSKWPTPAKSVVGFKAPMVHGFASVFSRVPACQWPDADKIAQALRPTDKNLAVGTAIHLLRGGLQGISSTTSLPKPVQTFASRCLRYTRSQKFQEEFKEAFAAVKSAQLIDSVVQSASDVAALVVARASEQLGATTSAGASSSLPATPRDNLGGPFTEDADDGHGNDDNAAMMTPMPGHNAALDVHGRNKPKMSLRELELAQDYCFVALSSTPSTMLPRSLVKELADQACATTKLFSLKCELSAYLTAEFDTVRKLATYGVQMVNGNLTLTKKSLYDDSHWQHLELRSARKPVSWDHRLAWMGILDLLACLVDELREQKDVRAELMQQLFVSRSVQRSLASATQTSNIFVRR